MSSRIIRASHLGQRNVPQLDPLRFFIVTRAVVGVCRTLVEEPEGTSLPMQQLEDELVRLVEVYL